MEKQHFFFRLIPPRRTFPGDATADELALMKKHAEYFAELFNMGKVALYGPVRSSAGAFGIAILGVEIEAQAVEIAQNDPSVVGGLNRFDVAPMRVSAARARGEWSPVRAGRRGVLRLRSSRVFVCRGAERR
jgi:hypothetical protein